MAVINIPPWRADKLVTARLLLVSMPRVVEEICSGDLAHFFQMVVNNQFWEVEEAHPRPELEPYRNLSIPDIYYVTNPDASGVVEVTYEARRYTSVELRRALHSAGIVVSDVKSG